jgi:hypothetical protein
VGRAWAEKKLRHLEVFEFFDSAPEPREERTRLHPLVNILVMALLAIVCVCEVPA